jgi:hypothetical protein
MHTEDICEALMGLFCAPMAERDQVWAERVLYLLVIMGHRQFNDVAMSEAVIRLVADAHVREFKEGEVCIREGDAVEVSVIYFVSPRIAGRAVPGQSVGATRHEDGVSVSGRGPVRPLVLWPLGARQLGRLLRRRERPLLRAPRGRQVLQRL